MPYKRYPLLIRFALPKGKAPDHRLSSKHGSSFSLHPSKQKELVYGSLSDIFFIEIISVTSQSVKQHLSYINLFTNKILQKNSYKKKNKKVTKLIPFFLPPERILKYCCIIISSSQTTDSKNLIKSKASGLEAAQKGQVSEWQV